MSLRVRRCAMCHAPTVRSLCARCADESRLYVIVLVTAALVVIVAAVCSR